MCQIDSTFHNRQLILAALMALVVLLLVPHSTLAGLQGPVLVRLFDEEVVTDNVFAVLQKAQLLEPDDRYQYLRSWVFPGPGQIRLFAKLTASNPRDTQNPELPYDDLQLNSALHRGQRRVRLGGNLVSPVDDLIDCAQQLNRIDELRADILAREPKSEIASRSRLCLLALIEMAQGHEDEASKWADQLIARLSTGTFPKLINRMPETLFVWAAAERGMLLNEAERVLVPIWDNQIQPGRNNGPDSWDRMMPMLLGRVRQARQTRSVASPSNAPSELTTWYPVTRRHAWTAGIGLPAVQWQVADRSTICLSRQDDEYLLLGTPLSGDLTFECLCTGFGYKDCHPCVSGTWIAPVYTHETVSVGDLWSEKKMLAMTPKLSQVDDWIRYRVQIQGRLCSRYINGRLIQTETLPEERDPWVAIRIPIYGNGQVRDVRITGSPTVPDRITLSNLRSPVWNEPLPTETSFRSFNQLYGWMPWHINSWKLEDQIWQLEEGPDGETIIMGRRQPDLTGTGDEQLLRYHWPLLWDSEVTYDFFYQQGMSIAHPAIGRWAFLLASTGLQKHWVTNGVWEQTDAGPLDSLPITGSPTLPLKDDAWNSLSLRIVGDTLQLKLNGIPIHEEPLVPTSDRTFGLYYDSGVTEARVRHVVLQGNWPKTLPPVSDQELRGTQADEFNRQRDALPAKRDFDFTRITPQEFEQAFLRTASPLATSELKSDGLHVTAVAPVGQYASADLFAKLQVEGDFDITSRYENLQLITPDEGFGGIYQCVLLNAPAPRNFNVVRSAGQYSTHPFRHVIQTEIRDWTPNRGGATYPAIFANESSAGRMRTIRRGKTLTTLAASYDSDSFQILYSEEVSDEPLRLSNLLRVIAFTQTGKTSEVRLVWKELQVRAEKITPWNLVR